MIPFLPGEIRFDGTPEAETGRFEGPHARKRWYKEVGGTCVCGCWRPLNGETIEERFEGPAGIPYQPMVDHLTALGLKFCACRQCGFWEIGPLREGEERRFEGCMNKVLLTTPADAVCHSCPPVRRSSGKRICIAA